MEKIAVLLADDHAIIRDGLPLTPERDRAFEGGDELLFIVTADSEADLAEMLADEPEDPAL